MEYIIAEGEEDNVHKAQLSLQYQVEEYLKKGFKPIGSITVYEYERDVEDQGSERVMLMQPMIK